MQMRISLTELDRRWAHIQADKPYHGEAVAPRNTSWFEQIIGISRVCAPAACHASHEDLYVPARTLRVLSPPDSAIASSMDLHAFTSVGACSVAQRSLPTCQSIVAAPPDQAYDPRLDEEDLYREQVPAWRTSSAARASSSEALTSHRLTSSGMQV